jgi:hypothetical protein
MRKTLLFLFLIVISSGAFAQLPACKDAKGNILLGTINQLRQIRDSDMNRPQVFITGIVTAILRDDNIGLPHQKYFISVGGEISLQIVSNLDFGRIPVQIGETVSICGEYLNVDEGMIHWTHFAPHGGHANGFTIFKGQLYGNEQTSSAGETN